MSIHATAVIHPKAELDPSVIVGPFAVIDEGVRLEADCEVGPHAHLTGQLEAGKGCRFHTGVVIGDAPQDMKYANEPTRLLIGASNVFREHVTVHRSNSLDEDTTIGEGNFFMANSHLGHNCHVGNHNVIVNGALIAGHVTIEDRAFISGSCMVHQFARIGTLSMMQGGAGISKDLPPFMMSMANNTVCGLNTVGLRRAGLNLQERTELKKLYHHLYSGKLLLGEAVIQGMELFSSAPCQQVLTFVQASKRGICRDIRDRNE
ncbi:MAG: acyl-ACP--UDP-N-acetylglucosamine O-acyltransferase [Verrucomicrobia bacterium]|jgi:UDP-N-acetylglucosamine acyltransferase|nr:acyl-ACP--UDP-N-acetylglucosamine O-acyltransferase [Verrucomicrobiota bacterium]